MKSRMAVLVRRCREMTGHSTAAICRTLAIGRATPYRNTAGRPVQYAKADDCLVAAHIREIVRERGSYGYRPVTALVNETFGTGYNRKRIRSIAPPVRDGAQFVESSPARKTPEWPGAHRPHCPRDVERTVVELGFVLDCHDREAIAHVAVPRKYRTTDVQQHLRRAVHARFGAGRPREPVQFLSDTGSIYTAIDTVITAERLGLLPVTTPAYSPQSNGMAEAFVRTHRLDYLDGADRSSAASVVEQIPRRLADYNGVAPHSALGYRAPQRYRQLLQDQRHDGQATSVVGLDERTVRS